jgi:hypothetical protein
MSRITLDRARAAKAAAQRTFERLGTVVGVGVTRVGDDYAVKINLSEPLEPGVACPTHVDGVPICIEVIGTIRKRIPNP